MITNEAGHLYDIANETGDRRVPELRCGTKKCRFARRLQDPLAELVKINPAAIGVGQYQHDMNQKKLGEALNSVVEDCVNKVGVDLNTASASLRYISRYQPKQLQKYCGLPRGKQPFHRQKRTGKVAKLEIESL